MTLRVDLFDTRTKTLIEAKAEASRNHLRLGIGQLLDYARYLEEVLDYIVGHDGVALMTASQIGDWYRDEMRLK